MHPCLSCGACCATYRVAFHWLETAPGEHTPGVPVALTGPLDAHRLVMAGTKHAPVRCTALAGEIGGPTQCTIYAQRPSVCREVTAAGENGQPSPQCDRARIAHGLAPLTRADWQAFEQTTTGPVPAHRRRAPANEPDRPQRYDRPA